MARQHDPQPDHEVAVIGAGFSGIGTAIKLDRAGMRDWVLLEAGDGVGGAWHWNTYPGIGVDIPSFSYQFSFEQRADWSRVYAPGDELKAYAEHCVDELRPALADPPQRQSHRGDLRRRAAPLAPDHGGGPETDRALPGRRDRRLHPAQATRDRRARLVRGHGDAHGALGPRAGPARPPRGGDRHRRLGGPGDPLDRARGREAGRAAAHADLVPAQARRAAGPAAVRRLLERVPGAQAAARAAQPGLRRGQLSPAGALPRRRAAGERGGTARAQAPAPLGPRPGGARQADAALRARLQAAELLQRVPADLQPAQRRARDRRDRDDHADRSAPWTAPSTRSTCSSSPPASRSSSSGNLPALPGPRRRRGRTGAVVGRQPLPGLRGRERARLPQHVPDPRPLRLQRRQLLHPDREPGAPHRPLPAPRPRDRRDRGRGQPPRPTERYFETMLSRRGRQVFFTNNCAGANSYYFDSRGDAPFRSATTLEVAWHSAHFDLDDYRFSRAPAPRSRAGSASA